MSEWGGGEVYISGSMTEWVSGELMFYLFLLCIQAFPPDFTHRCLFAPESNGNAVSMAAQRDNAPMLHHVILDSPTPTPFLREWAKETIRVLEKPMSSRHASSLPSRSRAVAVAPV